MKKHYRIFFVLMLSVSMFAFFGCAGMETTRVKQLESQLSKKDGEIKMLKSGAKQKDAVIEQYMGQLNDKDKAKLEAEMRAQEAENAANKSTDFSPETALLPPEAKPNECYARVFIPPVYQTRTEQMLNRSAAEKLEVVPAKYEWVEEKVLVQEASQRLEVIPAQYGWAEERVLVKSASSRMEKVPAQYEWVSENVLVEPAHTVWKKGRGPVEKIDNATGEIMCLVEIPAAYKTVKKNVMTSPPKTESVEIPAEYKMLKKQVMVKAPVTQTIEIPAVYKTVKIRKMVSPPEERRISIPEEYQTVTKTDLVSEGTMEWRRILCETNMSPAVISKIQNALLKAGHNPGPIDGVLGSQTNSSLRAYQKEKGLAVGALTYNTLESLGVSAGQ